MSEAPPPIPYDFDEWDAERFRRARDFLSQLASQREALASMRSALLRLYFQDNEDAEPGQ